MSNCAESSELASRTELSTCEDGDTGSALLQMGQHSRGGAKELGDLGEGSALRRCRARGASQDFQRDHLPLSSGPGVYLKTLP